MSRHTRSLTARRRDAALRRLRLVNRALIGASVAATGLLTDVAANAFPGHARRVAPSPTVGATTPAPGATHTRHRRPHARPRHALHRPAQPPAATTTSAPAPTAAAPTTAAPAPAAPAPASSPAPVVSGGS